MRISPTSPAPKSLPSSSRTATSTSGSGRPIEFSRFLSVAELFGYSFTFDGGNIRSQPAAGLQVPPGR